MNTSYNFAWGTTDNGNVQFITNCRNSSRTQNFSYDSLNRIQQANSSGSIWGEAYTLDPWGNLTTENPVSGKTSHEGLNTSANVHNQLVGFGYDAAGNMTSNGGANYNYDAENRLNATAGTSYVYDGDGKRVVKCTQGSSPGTCSSGATGTLYWTGVGADALAESNFAGTMQEEYVFFNGRRIARRDVSGGAVHYYFSDHLGSHGVVTNAAGTSCEQDIDYYPYGGQENDYCNTVGQHYKFTGKERDSESGLDEFGARYYSSSIGRFMIPDWAAAPTAVPYAHYGNPQSLNLYSYVQNNPTTLGDPDGHVDPVTGIDIAVEIATYIATHPEEVQAVEAEAGAGAGASRWGLLAGPALYLGAMLHPATVGQSDKDERAAMEQAQHEREQENGGVEAQVSTSGAGARQGGGGLRYENPGIHDPTSPKFVPGKTPLPSDAQAVFGTAIQVTGRASGNGQLSYGINEKGQFYRYSGQNGVLHYSGTIASNKVPPSIRKQLQDALKKRQSQ